MSPAQRPDRQGHRVAIIGDVAGHLRELTGELTRLGADAHSGALPPDLTVVQVGDLVHRGPASDGVVRLVDHYLRSQPDQWIQLVGNHEAQYLREPAFDWPERIGAESADTLRRWWACGQMRAATWVDIGTESFLVTHAGLTAEFWRGPLASPPGAEATSAAINALIIDDQDGLFQAGQMLGGRRKNRVAGPVWVAAATELLPSWLGSTLPFSQIHGHTSVYDWQRGRFSAHAEIIRRTTVDLQAKHTTTHLDGGRIIGVDPGHGRDAQLPWRAWETRLFDPTPIDSPAADGNGGD